MKGWENISKEKNRELVYLFSGPIIVHGGLEVEEVALSHIINIRVQSYLKNRKLVVYTDSKQIEADFNEFRWKNKKSSRNGHMLEKLGLSINGLRVIHIRREYNVETHVLAAR